MVFEHHPYYGQMLEIADFATDTQNRSQEDHLSATQNSATQSSITQNRDKFPVDATDAAIVQWCLDGHQAAWELLFQRYSRLIYKVPVSFGFPQIEVEEIYQEIAIEIVRSLPSVEDPSRLHPWLVTIARRVCIRRLRSATKYPTIDVQLLENEIERNVDTLEEMLLRLEEYRLLHKALAELEPRCRALLTQLFLQEENQSHAEVASELKIPLGSIGPTRARCLAKLREQLENLLQEPTVVR